MKRIGATSLAVLIGGVGAWLALRDIPPDTSSAAAAASPLVDNTAEISTLADDRAKRQVALAVDGGVVRGDGFVMPEAGTLDFTSFNGSRLTQRFEAASVVGSDGNVRPLSRQPTSPVTTVAGEKSQARYPGFFEGLDLEYRFDGRDIEEFFHVDETLRQDVVRSGGELTLTTVFPGLDKKNSAVRPLQAEPPDPSKLPRNAPPVNISPLDATVDGRGDVMVFADHGRFVLPAAVAVDGADRRIELERHFEFTKDGLKVAVSIPAAWLSSAEGRVVIDPSIIDNRRTINLNDGNPATSSIVTDSIGRLHVVYTAIYNGNWAVAYSTSSTRGASWTPPTLVFSTAAAIYWAEPPTLAVDARDTLHVAWSMYGDISDSTGIDSGTNGSYGSLVRYARCSDGCSTGRWQFKGTAGGKAILPDEGSRPYQYRPRMAIDRDDTVHLMFMSYSSGYQLRYITIDRDEVVTTDREAPGSNLWDFALVVDGNNTPTIFWSEYRCFTEQGTNNNVCRTFLTRTVYDAAIGSWTDTASLDTRQSNFANSGTSCNSSYTWLWGLSTSVGSDGRPLVSFSHYVGCNGYFPAFVAFNPANNRFEDASFIRAPTNTGTFYYAQNVLTTVDREGDIHAVWNERSSRNVVLRAQMAACAPGVTCTRSFGAEDQLLRAGNASLVRLLRTSFFPQSARAVDGTNLSMVVVFGGNSLQYISTGAPLDSPIATAPRNHSYVSTVTPIFSWQKLRNDPGTFNYLVQVDESPLFDTPALTSLLSNTAALVTYAPGALTMRDNGCYYWRVRAQNAVGSGPFSEPYEFCVDTSPPLPAQLVAPADGSDPGSRTPTFIWQPGKP